MTDSAVSTHASSHEDRPILLTAAAIDMGKRKLAESTEPAHGLRLGVKGGGCSGYYYVYELATKIREGKDRVFDFDGLTVVVDERSLKLLEGGTLDWETKLMSYGFKWLNPNAVGDCGCGQSFHL